MATKVAKEVYRGYMPVGLPQHRPRQRIKPWHKVMGRPTVNIYPPKIIEGYSDEPEYPPLNDGSRYGCNRLQKRLDWYEELKNLPTCEQKMHEIGRHVRHYIAHFPNWMLRYNSLPMAQYLTRTHVVNTLPESYKPVPQDSSDLNTGSKSDDITERVKDLVLSQIELESFQSLRNRSVFVSPIAEKRYGKFDSEISNRFLHNIFNTVKRLVVARQINPELHEYQVDLSPAIRSWMYHSGVLPPNDKVFYRARKDDEGRISQMIQIDGLSAMNLRSRHFIEPVLPQDDPLVTDISLVEEFCYPLKEYGAMYRWKNPVSLAGYWLNGTEEFNYPHTCLLSTDCVKNRQNKTYQQAKIMDDMENCLNTQAVLTQFAWLNSMSMYHGFTPFHEVTYPFTSQAITTDGQNWMFNVYQLNAHTFHRDLGGPQKNNICWSSGSMKLYESYEGGQFRGINDEPIRLLVRFLSQKTSPSYTSQLQLCPLLGEDSRTEEERAEMAKELKKQFVQFGSRHHLFMRKRPLYEHLFFRSKEGRNRITHAKAPWHPKPIEYPRIFE